MASFIYSVRTTQKDANADVMVRIRFSAYVEGKKVDTYAQAALKSQRKHGMIKRPQSNLHLPQRPTLQTKVKRSTTFKMI